MRKKFYAILLFFSLAAHSYDLQHLGTIHAKEYNDVWKQWFDKDIEMYAGSDGESSNIRFVFEMNLGEYALTYAFWGMNPEESREFMDFYNHLVKAQEWSKIARENRADTERDIGDCSTSKTKCKISFRSTNSGKATSAMIEIKEKAEFDFTFNEGTFMVQGSQLDKMVEQLNPLALALNLSASSESNNQADDLFN